jgi:hypothetical protein
MRAIALVSCLAAALPALADEGMWTFDNFPADAVRKTYGADVTAAWLDHVRLATVRLTNCTGSFVSPEGLFITNHHCMASCLGELSSRSADLLDQGFLAADRKDERRCDTQLADVLVSTENITPAVIRAGAGLGERQANDARKKALTTLEQACEQTSPKKGEFRCQAVTLYGGGQYFMYKYKRYDDVRLVFTPETDIADFGGDPDNFQFPRWSLDVAILRAYENGKPAKTPDYLKIDFAGPQAGQLVFVAGQPGSTSRLNTRAELEFERDVSLPTTLLRFSELRGGYMQFSRTNPVDLQLVEAPLSSLENSIKVRRKLLDALHDDAFLARKSAEEETLRTLVKPPAGEDPWRTIEAATARERALYLPYVFIEGGAGFNTILFRSARLLVRGAEERAKPNVERLREYTQGSLPRIEQQLDAQVPIYGEVESLTLSFSLQRMQEWLGPDYPLVRRLLARDSPESLATRLVAETKLDDAEVRRRLWAGGKAAIDASRDPMIELARSIDGDARALRKEFEDEVEAPIAAASTAIAMDRFKSFGARSYPDATFTLRLNYGTVTGWVRNGAPVAPFTHLERAFERASGAAPFRIPESWMKVKERLDMSTPFCLSTNNDIVGGNSGSPLIDAQGHMVGLIFDGNIESIAGSYRFDPADNRAIAVHPAIIREALDKVYGAKALLAELGAP